MYLKVYREVYWEIQSRENCFSHKWLHPETDCGRSSRKAIAAQYMRKEYSSRNRMTRSFHKYHQSHCFLGGWFLKCFHQGLNPTTKVWNGGWGEGGWVKKHITARPVPVLQWHPLQAYSEPGTILDFSLSPGPLSLRQMSPVLPSFGASGAAQWQKQDS